MKLRPTLLLALAVLSIAGAAESGKDKDKDKDKPKSDILGQDKRRPTVELAQVLTRPPEPEKLPADLAQPFNPAGFDLPDRDERPPVATSTARGGDAGGGGAAATGGAVAAGPAPVLGDRELLEVLVAKLPAGNYIGARGEDFINFAGTNGRVKVGGRLQITDKGQTYEVEVTAINSNNFTIRYRGQNITRANKLGK